MVRDRVRVRLGLRIGLELALGLGMDEPQCIILRNGGPPEWPNGGPKSSMCCYFVVRCRRKKFTFAVSSRDELLVFKSVILCNQLFKPPVVSREGLKFYP